MPNCRLCRNRIDLSITNVRAYKCEKCKNIVCKGHFEASKGICYSCADLPIGKGGRSFSFIRKQGK